MAKIKLPSGRTVTVNLARARTQLRERKVALEGAPPEDLKLRVFVDALGVVGLDLDSTFGDLEAMVRAIHSHEDD